MVVDKKWEVVQIAMLCDAPKKGKVDTQRSGQAKKRHGRECSRNTHRRRLLRGEVKRPGRILNQMQLRRSSAHGNEGPRDQVFIVIGRRRLIGFWMGGWYERLPL